MALLPASIENALRDAGFSPTEILILNHLLAEEGMTLRGLAAKTGKSTGVLDQAMKKLLRRRVVEREMVNDSPKYIVHSLQSIVDWMEQDTQKRREEIDRRYSNFESFMLTIERERSRPRVEHFEGFEGIKKAYSKLLEYDSKDLCAYIPTTFKEEEDPLRDFKVQWFRDRYNKGVFLRVLAHDTVLGKRFVSRDAFEYRKTLLLDPDRYPFTFEKYVINGTVACIDYNKRSATFLHYPEMAKSEHEMFERLWQKKLLPPKKAQVIEGPKDSQETEAVVLPLSPTYVPPTTRLTSLIREFFVSPKSWMAMGFCAVLAASLSFTIYNTSVRVNTERIRERVTAIASTATVEFNPDELNALRSMKDVETSNYKNVVYKLQQIRRRNQDIMYVYILRPSEAGTLFEFIADADAEHPDKIIDTNNDGEITSADDLGFPGVPYDVSYVDVLRNREYEAPIATREAYTDKWGTFFTGYAPIRDQRGKTIALLAVDMTNQDLNRFNQQTIQPLMYFLILFLLFVLVRFSALNRSILSNMFQSLNTKRITALLFFGTLLTAIFGALLYFSSLKSAEKTISEKSKSIAATAASQFDYRDIAQVWTKEDMKKEEYSRLVYLLQEIRRNNPDVTYAYIMRKTEDPRKFLYVADADALKIGSIDYDGDSVIDSNDQLSLPGDVYVEHEDDPYSGQQGFVEPTGFLPYTDEFGTVIAGWAPIFDDKKEAIAIVGIDILADKAHEKMGSMYSFLLYFSGFFAILLFIRLVVFHPALFGEIGKILKSKFTVRILVYGSLGIVACFTLLFVYTLRIVQEEAGKRLMSIATTASSQFNIHDLNQLRQAKDMQTETYQKIYKQLLYIRDNNPGVRYVYIMRPTETDGIWEFVADADTNYFFPESWDFDQSGVIDAADENVHPGERYDAISGIPNYKVALEKPVFDISKDQWGEFISGYAPIKDEYGETIAVLGIDSFLKEINSSIFHILGWK